MNELSKQDIALMMKFALEFNSEIVTLAAKWYGNIYDNRSSRKFVREYKRIVDNYTKNLKLIADKYEKT